MRLILTATLLASATAFAPAPSSHPRTSTVVAAKGLSIGDIGGGGGKPTPPPPPPPKGLAPSREKVERKVPTLEAPSLPSFSAPKLSTPDVKNLFGATFQKEEPPPPPPKKKFSAPKISVPKVSLPKAAPKAVKVTVKAPDTSKVSDTSLNPQGRILVDGKYKSRFGSLVDRKVVYDPLGIRDGVAPIATPQYLVEYGEQSKGKGKGGNPLGAIVPVLAAGAAAVAAGSVFLGAAGNVDVAGLSIPGSLFVVNDGTVDVSLPKDPAALASKAAAGKPIKARLAGLPVVGAQDIFITVGVKPASAAPVDIEINANGGVGAGLKALSGGLKANVNGVPIDAGVGLKKGEAAIKVKSSVIPAVDFPLKN